MAALGCSARPPSRTSATTPTTSCVPLMRPSEVPREDALRAGGVHEACVSIRLRLARAPAERCDAVEAGPATAGDEAHGRLRFGHEAIVCHALERQIEHAGPDLNVAVGLCGDFLDDAQPVSVVVREREQDVEPVIRQWRAGREGGLAVRHAQQVRCDGKYNRIRIYVNRSTAAVLTPSQL